MSEANALERVPKMIYTASIIYKMIFHLRYSKIGNMSQSTVRRFVFDLDKHPSERWIHIINEYKDKLPRMKEEINKLFQEFGVTGLVRKALNWLIYFYSNSIVHREEIASIAKLTNLDFEQVLLMQLMYEINSACSTLITHVDHKPVMFRTMDWDLDFLRELTVELSVVKNGQEICVAPTWVGCVGFFTAYMKHEEGNYAIALNYRRTFQSQEGGVWTVANNLIRTLRLIWPCSYLIRDVCENQYSFARAKNALTNTPIISPCYLTLFHPTQSCIITRDANTTVNVRENSLYQTNKDFGCYGNKNKDNIIWSSQREQFLTNLVTLNEDNFKSKEYLLERLFQWPIINVETIYQCLADETDITTRTVPHL